MKVIEQISSVTQFDNVKFGRDVAKEIEKMQSLGLMVEIDYKPCYHNSTNQIAYNALVIGYKE